MTSRDKKSRECSGSGFIDNSILFSVMPYIIVMDGLKICLPNN